MGYCVYCHTNKINGKKYVGITKQKPEKRWGNGHNYVDNEYFYRAIKKYGWEEFSHDILFTNLSKEEAIAKEIELISKWSLTSRDKGYNIQNGGEGADAISDESKLKISIAKKGHKLSEETKRKMSLSKMGDKHFASIPVAQYDDFGNKLAEFTNSREAEHVTGVEARNIRSCLAGKRQHAGGFVWKKIHS